MPYGITSGIIWLIDAMLKWLPGFRSDYMGVIMGQAQGQPGLLRPWFDFWINLQHTRVMFLAYLVAVVETLIAVALIAGFARKVTYISAAAFSVVIWATAEGIGGPYTSGSPDIGTAVIYAVVFAGLLALSAYAGPLQRGLLPGAEDLLVLEGRRGARPAAEQPVPAILTAASAPVTVPQPRATEVSPRPARRSAASLNGPGHDLISLISIRPGRIS
jgi:thiosulfate dehydrogenase [quinone] large subunit